MSIHPVVQTQLPSSMSSFQVGKWQTLCKGQDEKCNAQQYIIFIILKKYPFNSYKDKVIQPSSL